MRKYTLEELNNVDKQFKQFKNEIINISFESWVEVIENIIKQAKGNIESKKYLEQNKEEEI